MQYDNQIISIKPFSSSLSKSIKSEPSFQKSRYRKLKTQSTQKVDNLFSCIKFKKIRSQKLNENEFHSQKKNSWLIKLKQSNVRKNKINQWSPAVSSKQDLVKQYSKQYPALQLQKTYSKFYQILDNVPKFTSSKKYQDFHYKSRYFDISRRSLQQANIKILTKGWVAFDFTEQKYIIGWKNKEMKLIKNLNKLIIVNCVLKLFQSNFKKLEKIIIRINKIDTLSQNPVLQNNTKISIQDLLFGIMLTSNQQLIEYITINMGYYLSIVQNKQQHLNHPLNKSQKEQEIELYIKNHLQNKRYKNIFLEQIKQVAKNLQLFNTVINSQFQIYSCAIDLTILFNNCLTYSLFQQMLGSKSKISRIKFQVGYHYWQQRTIKWKNEFNWPENYLGILIGFKGNGNSVVAYNKKHELLITLVQSRYFKALQEVQKISNWCLQSLKLCMSKNYLHQCRLTFQKQNLVKQKTQFQE